MSARPLVIVQARWGSSRLPGKVLERIGNRTMLERVVRRAEASGLDVVVAVPNGPMDMHVYDYVRQKLRVPAVLWYGGPEDDVLGRFIAAAREARAERVVRVTADCPFLDPGNIAMIASLLDWGAPYASNVPPAGALVEGLDVEAFTRDGLLASADAADTYGAREHVTPWLRTLPGALFVHQQLDVSARPVRWSVDTQAHLNWARAVVAAADAEDDPLAPTLYTMCHLLQQEPGLLEACLAEHDGD